MGKELKTVIVAPANSCLFKSTIETLEIGVEYVQS